MIESNYTVSGMACGHCADFVAEEIKTVPGVTTVDVDVDNGRVTVTSEGPLAIAEVRTAVENAGYELTGAPA